VQLARQLDRFGAVIGRAGRRVSQVSHLRQDHAGQNDTLAAMVANLIDADLLLMLGDIDGLYTDDPHVNPDAKLIAEVPRITNEIEAMVSDALSYSRNLVNNPVKVTDKEVRDIYSRALNGNRKS
jgi:uridylate kinase